MAGTTTSSYDNLGVSGNALRAVVVQFNKIVDDLETLRARVDAICGKLDADAGVTDTNYQAGTYSSTSRVQAATLTAAKVGVSGTAISA